MARRCAAIASLLWWRIEETGEADPDQGYSMITGFAALPPRCPRR